MHYNTIDSRLLAVFSSVEYQNFTPFHPNSTTRLLGANKLEDKLNVALQMATEITEWVAPEGSLLTELCEECYADFYTFEQSAALTSPDYRGHLLHSCYVFLLGMYIIFNMDSELFSNLHLTFYDEVFLKLSKKMVLNIPNTGVGGNEKEKFVQRWAIAALFHDTSYQTQIELENINNTANNLTGFQQLYQLKMRSIDQLIFVPEAHKIRMRLRQISLPPWWQVFNDDVLQILANRMAFRLENYSVDAVYRSLHSLIVYSSDNGRWDHGLMGSIYFLRKYMKKLYGKIKSGVYSNETLLQQIYYFYDVTDAAAAFALHNFKYLKGGIFDTRSMKLKPSKTPITCLLIMADELQWWNRDNISPIVKMVNRGAFASVKKQLHDDWNLLINKLTNNPNEIFGISDDTITYIPIPYGESKEYSRAGIKFISYHDDNTTGMNVEEEWKSYSKNTGSLGIVLDYCLLLKGMVEKLNKRLTDQDERFTDNGLETISVFQKIKQDELLKAKIHLLEIGHEGYPIAIENLLIKARDIVTVTEPKNIINAVEAINNTIDHDELMEIWGFDIKRIWHLKQQDDDLNNIVKKLCGITLEDLCR